MSEDLDSYHFIKSTGETAKKWDRSWQEWQTKVVDAASLRDLISCHYSHVASSLERKANDSSYVDEYTTMAIMLEDIGFKTELGQREVFIEKMSILTQEEAEDLYNLLKALSDFVNEFRTVMAPDSKDLNMENLISRLESDRPDLIAQIKGHAQILKAVSYVKGLEWIDMFGYLFKK